MESPRTCIPSRGYTLIEMLIVIGLMLALVFLSLGLSLNNYLGDAARAERSQLITVLQTARADALNNVNQEAHGVALHPADHPTSYVLFEGDSYAAGDVAKRQIFDEAYSLELTATAPKEIIFCQLSGDATRGPWVAPECENPANAFDGLIQMTDSRRQLPLTININHEGAIGW